MLSMNDRMLKLATADMRTLARVDAVLSGEDTSTAAFVDADTRSTTFTDAARRLGISRPTVYQLVQSGRLDAVTMCGIRRITMKSITEFADGKRPADAATLERMKANAITRTENARKHDGASKGKRGAA